MTNSAKLKMLSACVVLCLAVIAGLGYSTWVLSVKVEKLENGQTARGGPIGPLLSPLSKNGAQSNDAWGNFSSMPRGFAQMEQWMDEIMNNTLFSRSTLGQVGLGIFQQGPTIDFEENTEEYQVVVKMLEGEEVELNTEISDGVFSVSGKVKRSGTNSSNSQFSQSLFSSEFSRAFLLDKPVDQAAMEVINEKGKTIIRLPKLIG